MTPEVAIAVGLGATYATASFALYVECVRPSLRWYRARLPTHVALAGASLIPATMLATGRELPAAGVIAAATTTAVLVAWFFPQAMVRVTGGPARLDAELGAVTELLSAAGRLVDVGDLTGATAQVAEARREAGPRALEYVEQWEDLISEERKRRRGARISRAERLTAMSTTYRELACGEDPLPRTVSVISIGTVAAVSFAAALLGALT